MLHLKKHLDTRLSVLCLVALSAAASAPTWGQQPPPENAPPPPAEPVPENAPPPPAEPVPEDVKRVPYIPEVVKAELRKEVKDELLEEMKKNNWAAPSAFPEWTKRIKLQGDARIRYEIDNFGNGNAVDYYPDFNAINTGSPFDILFRDPSSEHWLNTTQRRARARLRARLDVEANVGQGFFSEIRIVTGDGPTPVSTNQTIGASGGLFSKYQIWVDRVNIRYQPFGGPKGELMFMLGRFENPFFRTDLSWDDNVNFDGLAARGSLPLGEHWRPFLTGGAFPIFNTLFDFATERPDKFKSRDKWLYAAQAGTEWKPNPRVGLGLAVAFYFFDRVQGVTSSECDTHIKSVTCDTDHSRPSFAQKGNTYRPLRTPSIAALDAELNSGASEYQYFGLSSGFRDLVYTARLEWLAVPGLMLALEGEFIHNVAFQPSNVAAEAVNNFKPCNPTDLDCLANPPYGGGNKGYLARLTVGSPTLSHRWDSLSRRWDWSVAVSYRYMQSDAMLDAFANSEFALGGTNNKGFIAAATLALADNVLFTARWLSSDVIVGPQYSTDVLHLDMNVRF